VTVDSLRADHDGFMGYDSPTTPFLDSLVPESFVFPAAIVGGAPTYYSFPSIMASRHPLALGRDLLGLAPGEPSLPLVLKQAGYATAAFSAGNPYLTATFGYGQGFDAFSDFMDGWSAIPDAGPAPAIQWRGHLNRQLQKVRPLMGPLGPIYDELYFQYCQRQSKSKANSTDALRVYPAADVLVDQAREWLVSVGDAPFFLWLHLMDPHAPYYPPEKAQELMGGTLVTPQRARYLNSFWNRSDLGPKRLARHREDVIALYDSGIRWVDAQMARLVDALRSFNLWDNCIFALTADHGEEFLDHGGRFHPPSGLLEELIHVPMLIHVSGMPKKKVSESPFSLMNLAPTLLDAAHVPIPATFQGSSWWEQMQQGQASDQAAIAECVAGCTNPFLPADRLGPRVLAVREGRFKLIFIFDPRPPARVDELYDLDADPGEHSPLPADAEKPVRRRLLELARQHLQRSVSERDPRARLSARLRELRLEWALSSPQRSEIQASGYRQPHE
jgi:arylsulfatase A-like enzyme